MGEQAYWLKVKKLTSAGSEIWRPPEASGVNGLRSKLMNKTLCVFHADLTPQDSLNRDLVAWQGNNMDVAWGFLGSGFCVGCSRKMMPRKVSRGSALTGIGTYR